MQYTRYRTTGFSYSGYLPPGVKWLLIVNFAVFVLHFFISATRATAELGDQLIRYFGLWPDAVLRFPAVWQLVTYMFLHGGLFHVLFNMLTLWMFGMDLENTWGTRRFLRYYFLCGVGAGLCVVVAHLFAPSGGPTIGASGAIFGLLLAFGLLFPDRPILFWFLFPIKAKYFVMIMGAIAFMGSYGATGGGISHIAHLGGMLFGYLFLRVRIRGIDLTGSLRREVQAWKVRRAKRKFQVFLRRRDGDRDRWVH